MFVGNKKRWLWLGVMASLALAVALGEVRPVRGQDGVKNLEERATDRQERRRNISETLEMATVWVLVEGRNELDTGTGFVVAPGYAVTNAHVLEAWTGGGDIYIVNEMLPLTEVSLIDYELDVDESEGFGRDLALLKFDTPSGVNLPALTFNLEASKMDRVGSWGYPGVLTAVDFKNRGNSKGGSFKPTPVVYSEGTISTFLETEYCRTIVHTAGISGGNSGGPLINSGGEVVGINTWLTKDEMAGNVWNVAQSADVVVEFLIKNGLKPNLAQGQTYEARLRPSPDSVAKGRGPTPPSGTGLPGGLDRYRELESFFVMVPEGWAVDEEEPDAITLSSVVPGAWIYLGVSASEGLPTGLIAQLYATELGNATDPVQSGEDEDTYVSYAKVDDSDAVLVVSGDRKADKVAIILMLGDLQNPGLDVILDSIIDK
jgi:hypothetical protein